RETMNWFETRPLFGQTIVVTRTRRQASELSEQLSDLGADVIEAPTIELAAVRDRVAMESALANDGPFDWIIFTSANGVTHTKAALREMNQDVRIFGGGAKIAAIGEATADAIRDELALRVDLCTETFIAEALANELIALTEVSGKRFLLLRADIARPILRQQLEHAGAAVVRDVAIYETKRAASLPPQLLEALVERRITCVTFTSSSTAKNFAALLGASYREQLKGVKIASIGPITTSTLRELGLEPTIQAETFDIDGLVKALQS